MKTKTKPEIIQETVDYYVGHPERRSVKVDPEGEITCLYRGPNGKRCAVGRCCAKDGIRLLKEGASANRQLCLESALKEVYRGHEKGFWYDLQVFHDRENHWTCEGFLTEAGTGYIARLKTKYPA